MEPAFPEFYGCRKYFRIPRTAVFREPFHIASHGHSERRQCNSLRETLSLHATSQLFAFLKGDVLQVRRCDDSRCLCYIPFNEYR